VRYPEPRNPEKPEINHGLCSVPQPTHRGKQPCPRVNPMLMSGWRKTESASVLVVWGVCCLACLDKTEADVNSFGVRRLVAAFFLRRLRFATAHLRLGIGHRVGGLGECAVLPVLTKRRQTSIPPYTGFFVQDAWRERAWIHSGHVARMGIAPRAGQVQDQSVCFRLARTRVDPLRSRRPYGYRASRRTGSRSECLLSFGRVQDQSVCFRSHCGDRAAHARKNKPHESS